MCNPPSGSIGQFMVDTWSEVDIIKAHLLPDEIDIDKHETVLIKGISNKTCNTIGTVETAIYGKTSTFFIVPEDWYSMWRHTGCYLSYWKSS